MVFIGIDPGNSGGLAAYDPTRNYACTQKCSATEREVCEWLREQIAGQDAWAVIERVHAFPHKGTGDTRHPGQGVSSAFTFGQSYGFLRGLLVALSVPFVEVAPTKWQAAVGIGKVPGESITAKKNRHKARAEQLYPHLKVTHATADALLLAQYAWGCRSPFCAFALRFQALAPEDRLD